MGLCLIAEQSFWFSVDSWISMAKMAFGLGFVIFVHELGHFLVAKACGVKCEKFYIGFDAPIHIGPIKLPTTLFKRQWGETEYGIGIIPLGGYVKMLGQDDNPSNAEAETDRTHVENVDETTGEKKRELDPRSYTAKSVPQRMAIISAGVIMNLIFAVIFAAIAFKAGVKFTPCVIGSTSPGSPAWQSGINPGDKLIQLGENARSSQYLRFNDDLRAAVMLNGANQDLEITVKRRDGSTEEIVVRPSKKYYAETKRVTIGVTPTTSTKLTSENFVLADSPAAKASPGFEAGDEITTINGTPIEDGVAIQQILARNSDKQLTMTVERKSDDQVTTTEVTVEPNRLRELGLQLTMGPITSIQIDSPAYEAGIKVDDTIVAIADTPAGNPATLSNRLRRLARENQPVDITVKRNAGKTSEEIIIPVTLREPAWYTKQRFSGDPTSSAALGVAFSIKNRVASIEPGSPADEAGLLPGDVLQSAQFIPASKEERKQQEDLGFKFDEIPLGDEAFNWPYVHNIMQLHLPSTKVDLKYNRGGKDRHAKMQPDLSEQWFYADRGLMFMGLTEIRKVASVGEAMTLGLRETKESALKVIGFLQRLVTGAIPATNFGGPGTIAVVATMEASEGTARLLIFLTMLSANLAVINFLPIPVLDGGHMVFLTFEAIRGRPVDEKWAFRITMVGLSFILALMVFVIGLDVVRFIPWVF